MNFLSLFNSYKIITKTDYDNMCLSIANLTKSEMLLFEKLRELSSQILYKNPLEDLFNNKYPKIDKTYAGRYVYNNDFLINIDVRNFFTLNDSTLIKLSKEVTKDCKTDDEKALACLTWVIKNIKYVSDDVNEKVPEYWQFCWETLFLKEGDCEDGTICLMNLLQTSGVEHWKIRPTAAKVDDGVINGGHCFLTYYCEESDKWVLLDWCYWPNLSLIKDRKKYKEETFYKETWFSWNEKYCFATDTKNLQAFEN